MNNNDDDEAAARLLQEQIWMAELNEDELRHWEEQAEGGAEDDDDDDENENNDADPNPNNNNPEIERRQQQQQPPLPPPAENGGEDDDDDDDDDDAVDEDEEDPEANNADHDENNNLDDNDNDDPPQHDHLHHHHHRRRNAIDGGIAGDVIDDNTKTLVTRSLKCPLVLYFEILSAGGGGEWEDAEDNDNEDNNNIQNHMNDINMAAGGGDDESANKNDAIDDDDELRRQKRYLQQQLETLSPDNPVLTKGTVIYIGLDKNSKLSLVFDQFCKFVNSKISKKKGKSSIVNAVKPSDFEFVHATILDPEQTVEGSALMKNDRIGVFPDRSRQRAAAAELVRQQRESDRKYFRDLRQLLHPTNSASSLASSSSTTTTSSLSFSTCDIILDCRGRVVDERGYSQNVLATTIRANSILPSKRCRWLGMKIELAREELRRRKEMTISSCEDNNDDDDDDEQEEGKKMNVTGRAENGEDDYAAEIVKGRVKLGQQSDDEDDNIIMAEEPTERNGDANVRNNNDGMIVGNDARGVAKVEDDEDEYRDELGANVVVKANNLSETNRNLRAGHARKDVDLNSVWVVLPDHSPQAVKLLLEYCYTNRVPSLGEEAFVRAGVSASTLDSTTAAMTDADTGPVSPFRKQEWPDGGMPTISLHLALAGVALAEEAHMPRLSLMCEIAASQLVDNNNVVDVLSACQMQQQKTGNRLPILRRAAMLGCIMANGSIGIDQLYANQYFKNNLNEKRGLVVPSLLDGSVEIMPTNMNTKEIQRKKEKMLWDRKKLFENYDTTDKNKRIMERLKWRKPSVISRRLEIAFGADSGPDHGGSQFTRINGRKIWREQNDPPSLPGISSSRATVGRGTKRKSNVSVEAIAPERMRRTCNARSKLARNDNQA